MKKAAPLRHAESAWNNKYRCTGWTAADLTEEDLAGTKAIAAQAAPQGRA